MIIKYQFVNEVVDVDVSEELGFVLLDFDRIEYNNNHTESRRHISLDGIAFEGKPFVDPINIEVSIELVDAINTLLPQQQELLQRVHFEGISIAEIAREEGVNKSSVHKRLKRIYIQLKNFLV